jgi:AcrR family transcriptional regulator
MMVRDGAGEAPNRPLRLTPAPAEPHEAGTTRTPRTGRGERTRQLLLAAAQEEFWERGYLSTRVADIAARANVSHGTYYTYFADKEAVLWALAEALHTHILGSTSGVVADAGGDPVRTIELANQRYLEFYVANRKTLRLMDEVSSFDAKMRAARRKTTMSVVARIGTALRRLQAEGRIDPGLDVDDTALALAIMVGQYAFISVTMIGTIDTTRAARTLTTLWARGIGLEVPWGEPADGEVAPERATGASRDRADAGIQ